jgi:hypothetical protein
MDRAFSPQDDDDEDDKRVGACRPQKELDLIANVVSNWWTGINVKEMEENHDKDLLVKFWQ